MPAVTSVTINRAPVLALWAAVVAEHLGFARHEALTLGKALSGINAQSKGRALGIFKPAGKSETARRRRELKPGEALGVELMHRTIPAVRTPEGLRAAHGGKPMTPESVERYFESKFKDGLGPAREAMEALAGSLDENDLAEQAFALYEAFRPVIPRGTKGWGVAGVLDLERIRSLAEGRRKR
ncbi:MAG TPA: hypothetical protein VGK89_03850 [Candidatus Eisenbacteria bacterium]|jgi:hypothetical protein